MNQVANANWSNATLNTAYTYDQYKRLTDIHVNNTPVYGYELNAKNQRTGATLPDGKTWAYSYDALGQLTQAQKQDGATLLQNMLYNYDLIGNRTSATENSTTTNYTSNLVNQYTQIAAQIPTYDADGNMTYYNGWNFTWNGENRMIAAENFTTGIRVEADYDYMGRRSYKKVYSNNTLTKHIKFVYDGYKLIAEFDALNNDTKLADYLWQPIGLDVPLMRNEEYYIADGNKNIIQMRDDTGSITQSYSYTPFGALESPTVGDDNQFRFSSEYADDETSLVYYNYRYYTPTLGRWINRDPIMEKGGVNLYAMCGNNSVDYFDLLGYFGNGRRYYKHNRNLFNAGTKLSVSVEWDWAFVKFTREATDAEIAAAVFPGHSDFSRGYPAGFVDGLDWFDFTLEDEDWSTSPWPLIGKPENHFQQLAESYKNILSAIGIKWRNNKPKVVEPQNFRRSGLSCNKNGFQRAMHQTQDFYSHAQKGFYYDPSKVIQFIRNRDPNRNSEITIFFDAYAPGHLFAGTKPDNDVVAWAKAETETVQWLKV